MIPNNPEWSTLTDPQDFVKYDVLLPPSLGEDIIQDIGLGPAKLNDSQGRLDTKYWMVYQNPASAGEVLISRGENGAWESPTLLFRNGSPIVELSLTFDQLGNPVVFFRQGANLLKLYWFNPITSMEEIKEIGIGSNLISDFDVRYDVAASYSDALLFYVRGNNVCMRVQRDRYETEYVTPLPYSDIVLKKCGTTVSNRFQVLYRYTPVGEQ